MHTNVPEKLLRIVEQIDACGHVGLTRLTVLKRWFERPERLAASAVWVVSRAISREGKASGLTGELFREACSLLTNLDFHAPSVEHGAARQLYDRLRAFQNEYQQQRWGPVRIIRDWNLLVVEQALEIYLWHQDSPAHGYKLAADYCQHYDSRYGPGLSGPSRARIREIVAFVLDIEASEVQEVLRPLTALRTPAFRGSPGHGISGRARRERVGEG